jgi:hypothetical protein
MTAPIASQSPSDQPARPWLRVWAAQRWPLVPAAAFALVWLIALARLPLTVPAPALYHIEPIGEIRGAQTVGQTFVAPYAGLYRVDVALADYARVNTGPVIFTLRREPDGAELVRQEFAAEAIRGDVRYRFEFPPLADPPGQAYSFEFFAPDAVAGNAITAYLHPTELVADGQAFWAGQPLDGDLVFDLHFRVGGWQRARIWLAQASAGKPGLLGQEWFYPLLVLGVAAMIALLFRWLPSALAADEPPAEAAEPGE